MVIIWIMIGKLLSDDGHEDFTLISRDIHAKKRPLLSYPFLFETMLTPNNVALTDGSPYIFKGWGRHLFQAMRRLAYLMRMTIGFAPFLTFIKKRLDAHEIALG